MVPSVSLPVFTCAAVRLVTASGAVASMSMVAAPAAPASTGALSQSRTVTLSTVIVPTPLAPPRVEATSTVKTDPSMVEPQALPKSDRSTVQVPSPLSMMKSCTSPVVKPSTQLPVP